jgi:hypothetical protein
MLDAPRLSLYADHAAFAECRMSDDGTTCVNLARSASAIAAD